MRNSQGDTKQRALHAVIRHEEEFCNYLNTNTQVLTNCSTSLQYIYIDALNDTFDVCIHTRK